MQGLTNLLPDHRQRALRRAYFMRLGIVGIVGVTLLTAAGGVLLVPTYIYLKESIRAEEARLLAVESALSSSDESSLSERLSALSRDAAILSALEQNASASNSLLSLLGVPHTGVTLTNIAYVPAKKGATVALSGVAASRDALRAYQLALSGAPFIRSADLPVSAYAKDANNAFTITLTLTP